LGVFLKAYLTGDIYGFVNYYYALREKKQIKNYRFDSGSFPSSVGMVPEI